MTKRTFEFTRSTTAQGFFKAPEIRFELRQPGSELPIGSLVLRGRDAEWITGDGKCNFRIRRGFWGQRWSYAGNGEGREFARISFGFFRKKIAFAEGGVYTMKLKHGGLMFPKRKYALLAELSHQDDVVMTLMNTRRRKVFASDLRRPMAGTIESALPGMPEIWGALLLFQASLRLREGMAA